MGSTIVISNQAVACLTIEANQALHVRAIGRALNHEPKVHRNTLITHSGMTRISHRLISMTKLGTSTDGAGIQLSSNGIRGDALGILVQVGHAARVKMTKMLMP